MQTRQSGDNTQPLIPTKSYSVNHPYEADREVILRGAGYPPLGYLAGQIGAMDAGMPQFVKECEFKYWPDEGPHGSYYIRVLFTREAYPGQMK